MKFKRFMALAMAGVMTLAMAGASFIDGRPRARRTRETPAGRA